MSLLIVAAMLLAPTSIADERRLSPDEVQRILEDAARKASAADRPAPRAIEGEVGISVGTGGYREVFGTAVVPLGKNGTAIISAAGLLNACYLTGRELKDVRMVVNGAGASAIACTALIKALGGSDGVHWTEIEITPEASGRPWFTLTGSTAAVIAERGITGLHLSMSHDAGFATAFVVAEADGPPAAPRTGADA